MFERIFKLSEHKTTVKTEVMAGITTFMTMAYILAVNPSVLGSTGMDTTAVLLATALASCLGTLCMAFMANLPFALSAGMGLNAFMAYTVVAGYGYSWQGDVRHDMAWHCRRLAAGGLPGSPGGDKRGRDTKVSLPLLTPQPFLRTRLPSVARLNARGPQGCLLLQEHTLDRSGAFRSGKQTPCTGWPRTVMRGKLRKLTSGHNSVP